MGAMELPIHSLAALEKGHLSLKDFEWEVHLRPSSSPAHARPGVIPEIDLQALYAVNHDDTQNPPGEPNRGHRPEYADLVSSVSRAASTVGFFQVYNHGISLSALDALYSYARRFFALSFERKYEVAQHLLHLSAGPSGFIGGSPLDAPNKWWTEYLRVGASYKQAVLSLAKCVYCEEHEQQAFSEILEECSNGFAKLAKDLTIVLLEALGLTECEVVEKYIGGEISSLKLSHYPPCPQPNLTLGVPPHSDASILTILWQDLVGGLEMQSNGEWINVKPRHDALVVNIGDIFQVWSNDRYLSGLHRVTLNARESRCSIGYFSFSSGVDGMLTPIEELLQKKNERSKFRSVLMSEHRSHSYSEAVKRGSEGVGYLKC